MGIKLPFHSIQVLQDSRLFIPEQNSYNLETKAPSFAPVSVGNFGKQIQLQRIAKT